MYRGYSVIRRAMRGDAAHNHKQNGRCPKGHGHAPAVKKDEGGGQQAKTHADVDAGWNQSGMDDPHLEQRIQYGHPAPFSGAKRDEQCVHTGQGLDQGITLCDGSAAVPASPSEQEPAENRDIVVPTYGVQADRTA
ncbi:MAG: hypothetical protein Kow0040_18330 [Thermogutta sp.]